KAGLISRVSTTFQPYSFISDTRILFWEGHTSVIHATWPADPPVQTAMESIRGVLPTVHPRREALIAQYFASPVVPEVAKVLIYVPVYQWNLVSAQYVKLPAAPGL